MVDPTRLILAGDCVENMSLADWIMTLPRPVFAERVDREAWSARLAIRDDESLAVAQKIGKTATDPGDRPLEEVKIGKATVIEN